MASPQLEEGNYLRIHNDIIEHLAGIRVPGEARQVLDCIIRKTYGFHKKSDAIPLSQFCEMTHLSKSGVCKAISKLKLMNLIVTQKGNEPLPKKEMVITEYRFNKDFDSWLPLPKKETLPKKEKSITQKGNLALPKKRHSKDNISKDNPKDNIPPTPLFSEILELYHKILPTLARVKHYSDPLKTFVKCRWNEGMNTLEKWEAYFTIASKSDFLMGRKADWKANFEWLVRPTNLSKVLNGAYTNTDTYVEAAKSDPDEILRRFAANWRDDVDKR